MRWLEAAVKRYGLEPLEALVRGDALDEVAEAFKLPVAQLKKVRARMGVDVDLYFVHQDMWNLAMGEEVVEELDPNVMDSQEMKGCLLDLEVEVGHAKRRLHYATTHEPRLFTQDGMGNLHTSLHRALETTTAALDAIKEAQASSRE